MNERHNQNNTSSRGFASMDPTRQREIAAQGGRSVPDEKRSFSQNHQLAAEAGRKGGQHSHEGNSRADSPDSQNRTHH